jgi:hypothetical protein
MTDKKKRYRPNKTKPEIPPGAVVRQPGPPYVTEPDHGGGDGRGWRQFRKESK